MRTFVSQLQDDWYNDRGAGSLGTDDTPGGLTNRFLKLGVVGASRFVAIEH